MSNPKKATVDNGESSRRAAVFDFGAPCSHRTSYTMVEDTVFMLTHKNSKMNHVVNMLAQQLERVYNEQTIIGIMDEQNEAEIQDIAIWAGIIGNRVYAAAKGPEAIIREAEQLQARSFALRAKMDQVTARHTAVGHVLVGRRKLVRKLKDINKLGGKVLDLYESNHKIMKQYEEAVILTNAVIFHGQDHPDVVAKGMEDRKEIFDNLPAIKKAYGDLAFAMAHEEVSPMQQAFDELMTMADEVFAEARDLDGILNPRGLFGQNQRRVGGARARQLNRANQLGLLSVFLATVVSWFYKLAAMF